MRLVTDSTLAALTLAGAVSIASAQTVTVTISSDVVDIDWQTAQIDDLPGPDGEVSFSEAMIVTNNTPGHQTVGFAIPESDWTLQFLYPGRAVLVTNTGYYFRSSESVTIDGTTQTAFTGDTNPDGWEVVIHSATLSLNGDDSTLIGFDTTSVAVTGSNGLVDGNTGYMNVTLYSGGGSLVSNNTGGTIKIDRSSDNVVIGNTVQRVRVLGGGPPATDNRIGGPLDADRNFITGYGNWNGEGLPSGITVQIFGSVGTVIENNRIGTTPDGLEQGNLASTIGIGFEGENRDAVIRNNLIAGILGEGRPPHHGGQLFGRAMYFNGEGSGYTIVGNTIGLDVNDEPRLGSVFGLDIGYFNNSGIAGVQIGGPDPGDGNIIAGHLFNGVTVQREVADVRISGNSIYANQDLGIDLVPTGFGYGVTPNDPLDADTGGNSLQNFPEIDTATGAGASLHVSGTLHSQPLGEFTVEFFASPDCDASGFGEGQEFLGFASVSTDAAGDADFDVLLSATVAEGWVITATATLEPFGATSEFSACAVVTAGAVCADSGMLVEGTAEVNDFNAACGSDDTYWAAHGEVFAFLVSDPVVQFELIATTPVGFEGGTIRVDIEASKQNDNGNLTIRPQLFDFTTSTYVALGVAELTTTDVVANFELPGGSDPADFIEDGTNEVNLLIEVIQSSGLANVRTQLDEVRFNFE